MGDGGDERARGREREREVPWGWEGGWKDGPSLRAWVHKGLGESHCRI